MPNKNREYYWIIIIIGVVIGLIALLCPTATFDQYYLGERIESWDVWMIGYSRYYWWETGYEVVWATVTDVKILSLVSFIFILINLVITMIASIFLRKRKASFYFLISAIISIGLGIYYIISIDINVLGFWDLMNPHFGIIGIFLGSGIILLGFGVGFTDFDKIREPIQLTPGEVPITVKQELPVLTSPTIVGKIQFCPECGGKLSKERQKFCMECGTAI